MSTRATIALLVVLALLVGGYYALLHFEERDREQAQEARKAFEVAAADIDSITVQQEDYAAVVGERRSDGTWRITAPHSLDAYQKLWNRLAKRIADFEIERTLRKPPEDMSSYGLDYPRLSVSAKAGGQTLGPLIVGAADPTQTNRYARIGVGPVVLVSEESFFELNRSLDLLRRHLLIDIEESPVTAVEFAWLDAGEEVGVAKIEQADDGRWRMVKPIEGPLGFETAGAFVGELAAARAEDFVDNPEALSDYGLEFPRARVTVWKETGGETETIYFGGYVTTESTARIYAKWAGSDTVFTLPRAIPRLFPKHPDDWRDRRVVTSPLNDLVAVTIANETATFTVQLNASGRWVFAEPQPEPVDQRAAAQFFNALTLLRVERFAEAPEGVFEPPRTEVTLRFEGDAPPATVLLGALAKDDIRLYVRTDAGLTGLIGVEAAEMLLNANSLSFRAGRLLNFEADDVTAVSLDYNGKSYRFAKPGSSWRVEAPEGHALAGPAVMPAILDALDGLRSNRLESPSLEDPARYGLDAPFLRAKVSIDEDGEPVALPEALLGDVDPVRLHLRFAAVEGNDEVLLVPQRKLDALFDALAGVRPQ